MGEAGGVHAPRMARHGAAQQHHVSTSMRARAVVPALQRRGYMPRGKVARPSGSAGWEGPSEGANSSGGAVAKGSSAGWEGHGDGASSSSGADGPSSSAGWESRGEHSSSSSSGTAGKDSCAGWEGRSDCSSSSSSSSSAGGMDSSASSSNNRSSSGASSGINVTRIGAVPSGGSSAEGPTRFLPSGWESETSTSNGSGSDASSGDRDLPPSAHPQLPTAGDIEVRTRSLLILR
eukprot:360044-Chlamydomonas_euryale.AAC.1